MPMAMVNADPLLLSRVTLISSTTVEGALYGFAFAIYIFCAQSLYLKLGDRDRRRQHLFNLLYMSLAMALALIGAAVDAQSIRTSYVDHADYPGGGYSYLNDVFNYSPVATVGSAVYFLYTLMISVIEVWRLWVVWRTSQYSLLIVALPVLSLLAYLGFEIAGIVMNAQSHPTGRLEALLFYGTITFPLITSIATTVSITGRIFAIRRKTERIMGQTIDIASPYTSVISMLIESFALDTVSSFISLGAFAATTPGAVALVTFNFYAAPFIRLLAYLFVIYRVTSGRAWKEDTAEKLTTLQWNQDGLGTTQFSTQIRFDKP